uniref:Uncharacterized protein n=1 Tax=Strigamia maritima TaxID=126957 RepID=T1JNK7_STRMM
MKSNLMATQGYDTNEPTVLLHKLCSHVSGLNGDSVTPYYEFVLRALGNNASSTDHTEDEFYYAEKIKKKLLKERREKDAATFFSLHLKLQNSSVLRNKWAVLCFLMNLQEEGKKLKSKPSLFARGFSALVTSTPFSFSKDGFAVPKPRSKDSNRSTPSISLTPSPINPDPLSLPTTYVSSATVLANKKKSSTQFVRDCNSNQMIAVKNEADAGLGGIVSEHVLLRELVYIFQGIEGKIIKLEAGKDGFRIDHSVSIPKPTRNLVLRLAELGWLHNKVKKYHDARSADRGLGQVGQSFVTALNQELAGYYRLLALLESQLQQDEDPTININSNGLTLRRLQLWTLEPVFRLRVLAALVDVCKGLKGGALASAVYSYHQHGDPSLAVPIYTMLDRWIFDGELEDQYSEFFVAADPTVSDDKLWHDKYKLRKSMVPNIISMSQAKKILSAGKSINFLRQVCQDPTPLKGRDAIRDSLDCNTYQEGYLQNIVEMAYKETSRRLLDVMQTKYKFMDHLKVVANTFSLGQGDFIRHLMDILESDLSKPACQLYRHNLSGSLEAAIRATNAQFDDPDILKRLDVRLLEVSPGDFGWDVFSLDYHVDGPIGTVFSPSVVMTYLRLFNALWRAKRMEYVLSNIWKSQMSHGRILRIIPELNPVLHQCYMLASEMVHFVQQIQYYITFEVMECSWDVLERKVKSAEDLDEIIAAHEEFLETIMARALLDDESKELLTQLRAIYDLIIQLQTIQEQLCQRALHEVHNMNDAELRMQYKSDKGKWGEDDQTTDAERQIFQELLKNVIPTTRAKLRILSQSYQDMVQKFLLMLTSHRDVSLQFLSFRLDFNEHYKNRDSRLRTHLTYQHRRQSSIGISSKC